jgi:dTDP-4-amino-4,6-dideoxygalactose transaminase
MRHPGETKVEHHHSPYQVVRDFEDEVAEFAGSKYAVAVDSCTNAIFLCCKYLSVGCCTVPCRTYPSVPCSVINAGGEVHFRDEDWRDKGHYRLEPYPIYDAAHFFQKDMYKTAPQYLCGGDSEVFPYAFMCLSFSATKPVNIGKGGMILTDDEKSVEWFKAARYFGRHEKPLMEDCFDMVGWNMYMTPEQAARGLLLMLDVEKKNYIAMPEYPDLSQFEIYRRANEGAL